MKKHTTSMHAPCTGSHIAAIPKIEAHTRLARRHTGTADAIMSKCDMASKP